VEASERAEPVPPIAIIKNEIAKIAIKAPRKPLDEIMLVRCDIWSYLMDSDLGTDDTCIVDGLTNGFSL